MMDVDARKVKRSDHDAVSEAVIGCAFRVQNALGVGFLEKVYENALAHEVRKAELTAEQQVPVKVWYDGVCVGDYFADLVVNDRLLVELKVARKLDDIHLAQCLNYLKATQYRTCLLINFGNPRLDVKRIAL